jgi:hypothetical protein
LDEIVEAAYTGSVRVNILKTRKLVDYALLGLPVILEAAQMWDDEIDIGILGCQQFNDLGLADDVD